MRIGIDIQSTTGKPSGLGYYTLNLINSLKTVDINNDYYYFKNNLFTGHLNTLERIFWEQGILSFNSFDKNIDILHVPGFSPPVITKARLIVTVHDLIGMKMPENNLGFFSRFYWGKYLPATVKRADLIITDSIHSKKDIVELLKVPEKKVRVIYLSAGNNYKPVNNPDKIAQIKTKYGISDFKYALFVGNIEPRKNILSIIKAWSRIKEPIKLVIAGSKSKYSDTVFKTIKENNLKENIIATDYIDIKDLVYLYNGASFFIYPSLYEGFGLPVLEAMSCGIPVITSKTTSLPEITGNSAITIDPNNIDELFESINSLIKDDILRKNLSAKGLLKASEFSWEKTAKETLKAYREI
ncbi:MAG: hypothetical protein A2252_08375 [Elusimicrobia bacterium RIFOXYA2_FULL_39_19]|nr:MAG: hypothetical protein A2252_08375 [Elusimicrobia bacterium RIFOXYA2_FULL_39_19]